MADSLYFKGERTVTKKTGDKVSLIRPKRGGDTHLFPQWWNLKGKVQYLKTAIFKFELSNGQAVRLVIPVEKEGVEVAIRHDGDGNFTFPSFKCIERIAVVAVDSTSLIHEYQFPSISSGRVLKRTVGSLPASTTTIGTVTVSGPNSAEVDNTLTYTAAASGDATVSYSWSIPGGGAAIQSGRSTASATIKFTAAGSCKPTCIVSSSDAGLTGESDIADDITVTVTAVESEDDDEG